MITSNTFASRGMMETVNEMAVDSDGETCAIDVTVDAARHVEVVADSGSTIRIEVGSDAGVDIKRLKAEIKKRNGYIYNLVVAPKLIKGPRADDLWRHLDVRITIPKNVAGMVYLAGGAPIWSLRGINAGRMPDESTGESNELHLKAPFEAVLFDECGGWISIDWSGDRAPKGALRTDGQPLTSRPAEIISQGRLQNAGLAWEFDIFASDVDINLAINSESKFMLDTEDEETMQEDNFSVKCVGVYPTPPSEYQVDDRGMPIGVTSMSIVGMDSCLTVSAHK